MAKAKTAKEVDMAQKATDLTKETAIVTLHSAKGAADMAENYVQAIYKAGYDANQEGLRVAKKYWDATSEIRQDWTKLAASTGEAAIESVAAMKIPSMSDAGNYAQDMFDGVTGMFESVTSRVKATVK